MVFSPITGYLLAGCALAVISSGFYGHHLGVSHERARNESAYTQSLQRAIDQANTIAKQDAEVSEYYEKWRIRTVTKPEEIIREITTPCMQCGIGDDALRMLNNARGYSGKGSANTGQPDGAVPPAPTPDFGQVPGVGVPLIGHQPQLLRLRHETQLTGGRAEAPGI